MDEYLGPNWSIMLIKVTHQRMRHYFVQNNLDKFLQSALPLEKRPHPLRSHYT